MGLYYPCKILNSLSRIHFNWFNRIQFKLILLTLLFKSLLFMTNLYDFIHFQSFSNVASVNMFYKKNSYYPWFFSDMTFFCRTMEFCCFFLPLPNKVLWYLSLPNLYLYAIRSMVMFLKVPNKVDFRVLTQIWIISYYWLTHVCKTLGVISY